MLYPDNQVDPKEVRRTMFSALPGLGLPIIIIGGIISGIFSATEAAAVAELSMASW